jgi:putative transcriptional regulator
MPVLVKLDDLLHARRMTLTELAERVDITLANLSILKTGKAKAIRFSTLESICEALECQPGDLLAVSVPDLSLEQGRSAGDA